MENKNNNENNKDIANSLTEYSNTINKTTNVTLDSIDQINKWYEEQKNKTSSNNILNNRIKTNIDNTPETIEVETLDVDSKIETKVDNYNEIQTGEVKTNIATQNIEKLKTQMKEETLEEVVENETRIQTSKTPKNKTSNKISTTIKGVKAINNVTNKFIKAGKTLNTATSESGTKSFETSSSKIMTKSIKKVVDKTTNKATNIIKKKTKQITKNVGSKAIKKSTDVLTKVIKSTIKLIETMLKTILAMLPQIAPILIIIVVIIAFCSFFGIGMSEETKQYYESYMLSIQNEYDSQTVEFYNNGGIVDGTIEGKGMINWKAPLAIIQMLNGDLIYDESEQELLNAFKNAGLYETITDGTYEYEVTTETTDEDGNITTTTEIVTETKKIVSNSSLDDYIEWCNNNFDVINKYKKSKNLSYDFNQTTFTDDEVEQIELLYSSTSFFDLFSDEFKERYAYLSVSISDEQIQAIYDEFLTNVGKRYLMDHSNLSYDTCMDYYDCSSWVIHCLAHTGIITIPDTTAGGLYRNYCYSVSVENRQAGDLIFLKDTYDTTDEDGISHVGIYMGELTINGETAELIIDTGGNPEGVKISKYNNGWWNGENFYGFGRLK